MPVAIKMLTPLAASDPENVKRFQREADLGMRIKHAHVAAILGEFHAGNVHALIMELVAGVSMEQLIESRGRLPWKEATHLISQVASALTYLGGMGVVHRDLKPGNILLTPGGVAKVVDLGFATAGEQPESDGAEALTMAGTSMGSPAYMPPEQIRDASDVSHAADVYSLGATMYHAVTGMTPFSGKNVHDVMTKVLTQEPVPPLTLVKELPPALNELILWSMAKNPAQRPADTEAFATALAAVVADPADVGVIRRLRRHSGQRRMWPIVMVVVLGVLLVGVLVFVLFT